MKELIQTTTKWPHSTKTIWLFRRVLYVLLVWYFGTKVYFFQEFFGAQKFVLDYELVGNPTNLFFQKAALLFPEYTAWFALIGLAGALVLGMTGILEKVAALLIWLFSEVLIIQYWDLTNGGENLLVLLLFYNVFLTEKSNASRGPWISAAHNFGLFAARLQVAILYATAGVAKLFGTYWLTGEAFLMVSRVSGYTSQPLAEFAQLFPTFTVVITYAVVAYQLAFPILVWFKKVRPFVLGIGLAFHFGIGFLNGIMDFALIMMASYCLFYPQEKAGQFYDFIRAFSKKAGIKSMKASGD